MTEVVADKVLDALSQPIEVGARVYVPERPGLDGGIVKGFSGVVIAVTEQCVTVEEFLSFHTRSIYPNQCAVQQGESKTSLEHQAIAKGGRKYLQDRVKSIQMREERAAKKAEKEE